MSRTWNKMTLCSTSFIVVAFIALSPSISALLRPLYFNPRFQNLRHHHFGPHGINRENMISGLSFPFTYQAYHLIRPTLNEASLKTNHQMENSYENSSFEKKNPAPTAAEKLDLNGDSFEKEVRKEVLRRLQNKMVKIEESTGRNRGFVVSSEEKVENQGVDSSHSKSTETRQDHYSSYHRANSDKHSENSAWHGSAWQMAMITFLLDMRKNSHRIKEVKIDKPSKSIHRDLTGNSLTSSLQGDPMICRLEPFKLCYRFDETGRRYPVGHRRPVRHIRVYKRTMNGSANLFWFAK